MSASSIAISCVGLMAANILEAISKEFSDVVNHPHSSESSKLVKFQRGQRGYYLIADLIEKVNNSFGFIQLVLVTFVFVWTTNGIYSLAIHIRYSYALKFSTIVRVLLLTTPFICFYYVVNTPHKIKEQVRINLIYTYMSISCM